MKQDYTHTLASEEVVQVYIENNKRKTAKKGSKLKEAQHLRGILICFWVDVLSFKNIFMYNWVVMLQSRCLYFILLNVVTLEVF